MYIKGGAIEIAMINILGMRTKNIILHLMKYPNTMINKAKTKQSIIIQKSLRLMYIREQYSIQKKNVTINKLREAPFIAVFPGLIFLIIFLNQKII
ncbi:hypothetical protein BWZ22_15130 [Seonamhaeicola sp. S2-3]|nr:hypothetical protein BWZ22_15130 [Seonamhaeicola sp. S2-3]